MGLYRLADLNIEIKNKYEYTTKFLKGYETSGDIDFSVEVSDEELERAQKNEPDYPIGYLESLEIYRKICYRLIDYDGILFHASCVVKEGEAYLFSATSGTGKSTHTRLWLEAYNDAYIINDDKPLLRFVDDVLYVYGTPWSGKDYIHRNAKCKVKGICKLTRNSTNYIEKLPEQEIVKLFLNQTIWFSEENKMDKLLSIIDHISKSISFYIMGCNISKEAAIMAYEYMRK